MVNNICGLYYHKPSQAEQNASRYVGQHVQRRLVRPSWQRCYLPQLQLQSTTQINRLSYATHLTQVFVNTNESTIEHATYVFPLYDGVTVCSFECTIGDRVIKGRVEEKAQARKTFQEAVEQGQQAGLLEHLPSGIFNVSIANIVAYSNIKVEVTYGGELKHDAQIDGLRYTLPLTIAPRYGDYPSETLALKYGSHLAVSRGMSITIYVDMGDCAVHSVSMPNKYYQDLAAIEIDANTIGQASASLTLPSAEMQDDFVLQMNVDKIDTPAAVVEKHPTLHGHQAIMASFVPKFMLPAIRPEIVFIADQSGSMGGDKNTSLIAALSVFLKSLPIGVMFNVYAFGTSFNHIFEKSQPYNQQTSAAALEMVQHFNAQFGGTELQAPVEDAFKRRLPNLPLEVILLTDGQIWSEASLFDFINQEVAKEETPARVFCLGIGGDVSSTLVEGVARAGNGLSQFVANGEDMDIKLVRMLKAALYPHLHDSKLTVNYHEDFDDFEIVDKLPVATEYSDLTAGTLQTDWNMISEDIATLSLSSEVVIQQPMLLFDAGIDLDTPIVGSDAERTRKMREATPPCVLQTPSSLNSLFPWNRTTAYLLIGDCEKEPKSVTLSAQSPQGLLALEIPVQVSSKSGVVIHQLAARKEIQELEQGRGWLQTYVAPGESKALQQQLTVGENFASIFQKEAVRLGVKYQVAGKYTSFVAIEDGQPTGEAFDASNETTQTPSSGKAKKKLAARQAKQDLRKQSRGFCCRVASPMRESAPPVFVYGRSPLPPPPPASRMASSAPMSLAPSQGAANTGSALAEDQKSRSQQDLPVPSTDIGKVRALISLQEFDGHWVWSEGFVRLIGVTMQDVKSRVDISAVTATSAAIRVLKQKFGHLEEVWDLCAEKAEKWLQDCGQSAERARTENLLEDLLR